MSSHREAPESSKDPVADNTDVYAFVSPEAPTTVTLIANYIPFQIPQGGPNFAEFGEDVLYAINVSNSGTAQSDIRFEFRFSVKVETPGTFLYNTGQIKKVTDKSWNRKQFYTITMVRTVGTVVTRTVIGQNLTSPPVNVGTRSIPDYPSLVSQTIHTLSNGIKVFAGQRAEAFNVDLGSIFDLGTLRPFNADTTYPYKPIINPDMAGINGTKDLNVHSIALQIPISMLTASGSGTPAASSMDAVIGVWATASRNQVRTFNTSTGKFVSTGDFVQVSRLAIPLINEVINPVAQKDVWNSSAPANDATYVGNYTTPQLGALIPALYSVNGTSVFPNLAAFNKTNRPRTDLQVILLTGIKAGTLPGAAASFQNYTGPVLADMTRLNMAIPPATTENSLGLLGGDAAGFPNGRRVNDNVVAIELRVIAGVLLGLIYSDFMPDKAAGELTDGTTNNNPPTTPTAFPYLGTPAGGYESLPGNPKT